MLKSSAVPPVSGQSLRNPPTAEPVPATLSATDDVSAAFDRGVRRGRSGHALSSGKLSEVQKRIQVGSVDHGDQGKLLAELLLLIEEYPSNERLQVLAARLIDADKNTKRRAPLVWQALSARLPDSTEALRMHLRWTSRLVDIDAARRALNARFPTFPVSYGEVLLYARACEEVKLFEQSEQAYEAAIALETTRDEPVLAFARSLHGRGFLEKAIQVIEGANAQLQATDAMVRFKARLKLERYQLAAVEHGAPAASHAGNAALGALLETLAARRAVASAGPRSFVGSILMLNGSLGSGGAERQLTNTATGLQSCIDQGRQLFGRDIIGPVTVCVRSLTSRPGADFFRTHLAKANIATLEYSGLESYGGNRRQSLVRSVEEALRFLPPQMVEGTERLTDVISGIRPEVVHIWQDGTIFATALAAVLAGVPKIVLSVRTVPPIDRPSRMKPQYEVLYPALLKMPGVVLSANSYFAARRYAEWLSVDPASIPVVHNGLNRLPEEGKKEDIDIFGKFEAATSDADFTVGCVMRFDDNKRPYLWLDCAAALLTKTPTARFILVGDGPLLATAKQYAEVLGITSRVLFTGQSGSVGFWLKQFDAFLLLSRFEGLPNVLIEAQLAGVPVVSTPAGGAAETVQQGRTGLILEDGENLDPRSVADALSVLRDNREHREQFRADAREWVERNFSVEQMLEQTVRVYTQ